jgi:hypothetical protein
MSDLTDEMCNKAADEYEAGLRQRQADEMREHLARERLDDQRRQQEDERARREAHARRWEDMKRDEARLERRH